MSDFSTRKPNQHGMYPLDHEALPIGTTNTGSGFTRVEQFITPDRLKQEWLFGIPLVSPVTRQQMSDDTLKNIIAKSSARVELECNIDVFPVVRVVRQPYDRTKSQQGFNQLDLGVRQVREILEVSIRTANTYSVYNNVESHNTPLDENGALIYSFPLDWIDMSLARKGLISFVPLQSAMSGVVPGGIVGGAAAPLMQLMSQLNHIPGYWFIKYSSGWEENSIPSIINDLIGTYTTMDVLSMLGPTNKWNSQSIGLDGASQGISGPGNQIYALRMQELTAKAESLKDLIKSKFTNKIFMRHV